MRNLLRMIGCALAVGLVGCSHAPEPKPLSPAQVQAQVDRAQNDPNIPPQIKDRIIGNLQHPNDQAHPVGAGGR